MLLLLHIITALSSLGFTSYLMFRPSRARLRYAYGLVGLTLLSGTVLVISSHAPVRQACTTGVVYLSLMGCAVWKVRRSLATVDTGS